LILVCFFEFEVRGAVDRGKVANFKFGTPATKPSRNISRHQPETQKVNDAKNTPMVARLTPHHTHTNATLDRKIASMTRTIHPLGLPETETSPARREMVPRRSRACHIVCTDCGKAADVTLDVLLNAVPATELKLRCLDCLGYAVTVTETTLVS
jgi:hypothetical protein